jgi:hypothetical protein
MGAQPPPEDSEAASPAAWEGQPARRRTPPFLRAALCVVAAAVAVGVAAAWRAPATLEVAQAPVPRAPTVPPTPTLTLTPSARRPSEPVHDGWSDRGAFPTATGAVLVFDDGLDGVAVVDLDRGLTVRRVLEGQRAGDQSPRLWRTGDHLVVGWGSIHAVDIRTAESHLVGEARTAVPAAEPGHLWLIDYPGGTRAAPTYRLVDLAGEVVAEGTSTVPDLGFPAAGTTGGLLFTTESGVALWDAAEDKMVQRFGEGLASVGDAAGDLVVWCADPCAALHATGLGGQDQVVPAPDEDLVFDVGSTRLSPDGALVASLLKAPGPIGDGDAGRVMVAEVETGEVLLTSDSLTPQPFFVAWSPDSDQLFFTAYGYGKEGTDVGRWVRATGETELATLPLGGTMAPVVLHRGEAGALLDAPSGAGDRASCPPAAMYPSGRKGPCALRWDLPAR